MSAIYWLQYVQGCELKLARFISTCLAVYYTGAIGGYSLLGLNYLELCSLFW